MLLMFINLAELNENKDKVTSVIFKKDEYTIEGIIRWLIDRNFLYDNFTETKKYYVFGQPNPLGYTSFEYRIIKGQNIGVELGVSKGTDEPEKRSIDELIKL